MRMRPSMNRLERKLCLFVYLRFTFVLENLWFVSLRFRFWKGKLCHFIFKVSIKNLPKIFPKHSKNNSKIEVWRPLEASWRRPGPSWASWGILGHLGWLHIAFRLDILAVLGASWGRLGGVLGRLGASLGASWGVSGRLGGVLGLIFYQNGTKLSLSILNSILYSIFNWFFINFCCPET